MVNRIVRINGQPGVVNYLEGRAVGVLALDIVGGRIRNIYIVSNPEKLERLPMLQTLHLLDFAVICRAANLSDAELMQ